jgi:YegS/Rv2252/BmrU family lipid kinase
MKYIMIVNPNSGLRRHQNNINFVQKYFAKHGLDLAVIITQYTGHAAKAARDASESDYDCIIAAGGDGTINEVLNGLIGSSKKMGIIPWGTGNVFAREMRFPRSLRKICKMIRKGRSLMLDAAKCGNRYFLLMCGTGFDAYMIKQIQKIGLKNRLGQAIYFLGAFRALLKYNYPPIEVQIDKKIQEKGSFVLVSNTSLYGVYFTLNAHASPVDGLLDVFIYKKSGYLALLGLMIRVVFTIFHFNALKFFPLFLKRTSFYKARSIRISSNHYVYTQVDGELAGTLPVTIECIPSAVNCILPGRTIRKFKKT